MGLETFSRDREVCESWSVEAVEQTDDSRRGCGRVIDDVSADGGPGWSRDEVHSGADGDGRDDGLSYVVVADEVVPDGCRARYEGLIEEDVECLRTDGPGDGYGDGTNGGRLRRRPLKTCAPKRVSRRLDSRWPEQRDAVRRRTGRDR